MAANYATIEHLDHLYEKGIPDWYDRLYTRGWYYYFARVTGLYGARPEEDDVVEIDYGEDVEVGDYVLVEYMDGDQYAVKVCSDVDLEQDMVARADMVRSRETYMSEAMREHPDAVWQPYPHYNTSDERCLTAAEYIEDIDDSIRELIDAEKTKAEIIEAVEVWVQNNDMMREEYMDGSHHTRHHYITDLEEWVSAMLAAERAA